MFALFAAPSPAAMPTNPDLSAAALVSSYFWEIDSETCALENRGMSTATYSLAANGQMVRLTDSDLIGLIRSIED